MVSNGLLPQDVVDDLVATVDREVLGDLNAMAGTPDTLLLPLAAYNLMEHHMKKSKKTKSKKSDGLRGITATFDTESRGWDCQWGPSPGTVDAVTIARAIANDDARLKKGDAKILADGFASATQRADALQRQVDAMRVDPRRRVVDRLVNIAAGCSTSDALAATAHLIELMKCGWEVR